MREYAIKLDGKYFVGTRYVQESRWQPGSSQETVFSPRLAMASRFATAQAARDTAINLVPGDQLPGGLTVVPIVKAKQ